MYNFTQVMSPSTPYKTAVEEWEEQQPKRQEEYEARRRAQRLHRLRTEENIQLFWNTLKLVCFDPTGKITSSQLYDLYRKWCMEEQIPIHPAREFLLYTKKHAASLHLLPSNHIPGPEGRQQRGFLGVCVPSSG